MLFGLRAKLIDKLSSMGLARNMRNLRQPVLFSKLKLIDTGRGLLHCRLIFKRQLKLKYW